MKRLQCSRAKEIISERQHQGDPLGVSSLFRPVSKKHSFSHFPALTEQMNYQPHAGLKDQDTEP